MELQKRPYQSQPNNTSKTTSIMINHMTKIKDTRTTKAMINTINRTTKAIISTINRATISSKPNPM